MEEKLREGEALFAERKIEQAEKCFLEIIEKDPENKEALNNLGVMAFHNQDTQKAIEYFTKALGIDPFYKDAIFNYSDVLRTLNILHEYIPFLENFIKKYPNDKEIGSLFEEATNSIAALRKFQDKHPSSQISPNVQKEEKLARLKKKEKVRITVVSPSDFDTDSSRRILWGDHWVKYELEREFKNLGLSVVENDPDVILYLFGIPVRSLPQETYNMVWLYSHPDMVTPQNLRHFDKIFCLSSSYTDKLRAMGYDDVELMIGATSKRPIEMEKKYDIVFVGNNRGPQGRRIITDIGEVPYNFKVWGNGWDKVLPKKYYGGRYFDNQKLGELYASSLISINDHHPDMSRDGFVAVKIFDILASGGFAISDRNTGIAEIFGDAVPQYESPEHLTELLDLYIARPDERLKLMEKGRKIALSHTYRERAEQFLNALNPVIEAKRRTRVSKSLTPRREVAGRRRDERIKVLYVDTISTPHAACNVNGMMKAYGKVSNLKPFDYRGLASRYGVAQMNQMLIQTALEFQPDLIHLGKSESISGSTIREIKDRISTYVIHFYGDFRWEPQPWVVDIGRYADCTLFSYTDDRILDKYRAAGVKNIGGFWDAGADPEVFYPRDEEKTKDVIFMGNNLDIPHDGYEKRRQLIEEALKRGVDFHVFGKNWEYLTEAGYKTLHIHPFVTENEFAEVCSSAKITLGINGVNDVRMYASWRRTVNTMASGAFHLTHYVPGMKTLFENKKHLAWFNTVPEAMDFIEYYLTHNEEREAIAEAGRKEVLARHTWNARIAEMLNRLKPSKKKPDGTCQAAVSSKPVNIVSLPGKAPGAAGNLPRLDNVHLRPIHILSYPKAGRTWMRLLIGKTLQLHYDLKVDPSEILEVHNLPKYNRKIPSIVFSHDDNPQLKTVSQMEGVKTKYRGMDVVFLCRDPRDVVISNFYQRAKRETVLGDAPGFHGTLEEFIRHDVCGIESIITFMNIWARNRHHPMRFHLVRYEDLKRDLALQLRRLFSFIGIQNVRDRDIHEAIEFCSFQNMKKIEAKDAFNSGRLRATDPKDPNSYKVRRGKVGGYKDYLGPSDIEYVDGLINERLDRYFGYGPLVAETEEMGRSSTANRCPVCIHIGLYKAASTFLQDVFAKGANTRMVLKHPTLSNDLYFTLRNTDGESFLRELRSLSTPTRSKTVTIVSDEAYSIGRFVGKDISQLSAHIFNLRSVNHYMHHDIEGMADRLKTYIPEATILMVIRNQTNWLLSVYKHAVLNIGVDVNFGRFLNAGLGQDYMRAGDYHRTYQIYSQRYGQKNVKVILFEDLLNDRERFFGDLNDSLGVRIDPGLFETAWKNAGIDSFTADLLRKINKKSEHHPTKKENPEYIALRNNLFSLRPYWSDSDFAKRFDLMGPELRESIKNHFCRGNMLLGEAIDKTDAMDTYGYLERSAEIYPVSRQTESSGQSRMVNEQLDGFFGYGEGTKRNKGINTYRENISKGLLKSVYSGNIIDRFRGLEFILPYCNGCSVLDIGSCEGLISYEFARNGASLIHGFDLDPSRIEFSNQLFRNVPVESKFIQADLAVDVESFEKKYGHIVLNQYDVVLYLGVYHHLKRQMPIRRLHDFLRYLLSKTRKWFVVRTELIPEVESIILSHNFGMVCSVPRKKDIGLLRIYEGRA